MQSDVQPPNTSDSLLSELTTMVVAACQVLGATGEEHLFELLPKNLGEDVELSASEAVRLALYADALYVASRVALPDDPSEAETDYLFALLDAAQPSFRVLARGYALLPLANMDDVRWFFAGYRADSRPFGAGSGVTRWFGLSLLRKLTEETGDTTLLDAYLGLLGRLADELDALDDFRGVAARLRGEMTERAHPGHAPSEPPPRASVPSTDPRVLAFCRPGPRDAFACVSNAHDVWKRDPADVDTIHAEARATFAQLIDDVLREGERGRGRMLLVLGEAGSGKTHLLRAMRERVHGLRSGYAAYLQVAPTDDVADQLAVGLFASLGQAYDAPEETSSSLERLADALLTAPSSITASHRTHLRDARFDDGAMARVIAGVVDVIVEDARFADLDLDLLRVLLVLSRREPRLSARVLKYLRGDTLAPHDLALLGHPAPRRGGVRATLIELSRIIERCEGGALVVLVDQLEDMAHGARPMDQLLRTLDELRRLVDHAPNCVVVISCARDFYVQSKAFLDPALVDRIERDPEPEQLLLTLSREENEAVIGRRMQRLMQAQGVYSDGLDACFPLPLSLREGLEGLSLRDALDHVAQYHARCVSAQKLVSADAVAIAIATRPPPPAGPLLGAQYQLHRTLEHVPPEDPEARLAQLADVLRIACRDLGLAMNVSHQDGLVEVCAEGSSPFVCTVAAEDIESSTLRELAAFQTFAQAHGHEPAFWTWVRTDKPLLKLPGILPLLGLSAFPARNSRPPQQSGRYPRDEFVSPLSGLVTRDPGAITRKA